MTVAQSSSQVYDSSSKHEISPFVVVLSANQNLLGLSVAGVHITGCDITGGPP
jgi:hypothetical protein